jgi:hypothetical protein
MCSEWIWKKYGEVLSGSRQQIKQQLPISDNVLSKQMTPVKAFVVSALLLAGSVHADDRQTIHTNELSESQIAMVDVSKARQPGKAFMAATIIDAPVSKLCSIILNFSGYPGFMPNVDKALVTRGAGDWSLVDMTLKLPLGKIKKYRLKMTSSVGAATCELSWKQVPWEGLKQEETIADTTGYWLLAPHAADKGKTVVKYFVYTDPGPVPMGLGWIVDSMSKDSIPKTLESLRNKARVH